MGCPCDLIVIEYLDPTQLALLVGLTGDYLFVRSAGVGKLRKALERGAAMYEGRGFKESSCRSICTAPSGALVASVLECKYSLF